MNESRTEEFKSQEFESWMAKHEQELGERFGQNPDILIKHNYAEGTVTIQELPSKNRKASLIDAIKEEE